jgi:hypothetical protein
MVSGAGAGAAMVEDCSAGKAGIRSTFGKTTRRESKYLLY